MELSREVCEMLINFGVGRRSPHDDFFKDNQILSEMSEIMGVFEIDSSNAEKLLPFQCQVPGCRSHFEKLSEFESHYNTAHRHTCCECRKTLPSAHFLNLHVAETHDCFFAVMVERGKLMFDCYVETCGLKFLNSKQRMDHCINEHKFPPNFRFDLARTNKSGKKSQKHKNKSSEDSEMSVDNNESLPNTSPKQLKGFNFSHSKKKTFNTSNKKTPRPSALDSDAVMSELKAELPEC